MSRFAFVHSVGAAVAPDEALRRMSGAMTESAAGPRRFRRRSDDDVGVATAAAADPHDAAARDDRLARADEPDVWLAFDGVLYERGRLRDSLHAAGARVEVRRNGDAALIIAAWRAFGEACVEKLSGDFAFVIWDRLRKTVFCARDIAGARPFFFHASRRIFAAASELRALLALDEVSRAPNEAMVGEYLMLRVHTQTETLYRDVARLPPAHCLRLRGARPEIRRYWSPRVAPDPKLRGSAADEAIRACLEEAVRDRMPTDATVGVELSGGLDSSSVAAVAHRLSPGRAFETLSLVFPGKGCDESRYIAEVQAALHANGESSKIHGSIIHGSSVRPIHHHLAGAALPYDALLRRAREYRDFPGHPNGLMSVALYERARARGMPVELTGVGADDWWSGASPRAAALDRLQAGDIQSAIALVGLAPLARAAVAERVPPWSRALRSRARSWLAQNGRPAYRRWVSRSLARSVDARTERMFEPTGLSTRAQRDIFRTGTWPWTTHAFEMQEREASSQAVELRHPFWDRRLIELALALPPALPESPPPARGSKPALRSAMRGLVPDEVRARTVKTTFGEIVEIALRDLVARVGATPTALARAGWVDAAEVEVAVRALLTSKPDARSRGPQPGDLEELLWSLWMVFALDLWATVHV